MPTMPNDPQYTERTHHGDFFRYRISLPGETFAEFMARSPYYSSAERIVQLSTGAFRDTLHDTGRADFGWSDFTYTRYQARRMETITWVERRRSSTASNPRWRLHTQSNGYFDTEPDASLGYGVKNMTNSRLRDTYILDGHPVVLVLNPRGHVNGIERNGRTLDK